MTARALKPRTAQASSKEGKPTLPVRQEPGPRNREAIGKAAEEYKARPIRVYINFEKKPDGTIVGTSPHSDDAGHALQLASAFGSTSTTFMTRQLGLLEWATRERDQERGQSTADINAGLAIVQAVAPQDELEAALAVQMAGCHALTMEMLGRAKTTDRNDLVERYGNLAVKLQRTFTGQIEALARMRGKGQQTVRVEHVTVHPGAQAIVGDVHHHGPGGTGGRVNQEHQPHGASQPQECAALPGPDPQRNGVPITGDAKRKVPTARRTVDRGAQG